MGSLNTGFNNAFTQSGSPPTIDPALCRALGQSIEDYVKAPYTLNNNAASSPTSAPTGYVQRLVGKDGDAKQIEVLDAFAGIPVERLRRANGTGASPTATLSADVIAYWEASGYYTSGGTGYAEGFRISVEATENWTSTANGSRAIFYTIPKGTNTLTKALTIGDDQSVKAIGPIGYDNGAGGAVTQSTSKSTGVTLNASCGQITMNNAGLNGGSVVSFVLTNNKIAAGDVLVLNHISGGTPGAYMLNARSAGGSATIDVRNVSAGALGEAIVIAFAIIKATTS